MLVCFSFEHLSIVMEKIFLISDYIQKLYAIILHSWFFLGFCSKQHNLFHLSSISSLEIVQIIYDKNIHKCVITILSNDS